MLIRSRRLLWSTSSLPLSDEKRIEQGTPALICCRDNGSPGNNPQVTAQQSNYGVNAFGDMSRDYDRQYQLLKEGLYKTGRSNIERLANQTGGRAWWIIKSNYIDGVNAIANNLDGQYLLTFIPMESTPGSHELRLECKRAHIAAQGAYVLIGTHTQ